MMDLNKNLLKSMTNIWINQECVQGLDFEYINFEAAVNMFEHM